ncbi:MAG: undecaprenyldiphospho-muramoylpentapeptide beta-N-acetylglucosaminyltransferase [Bacteroidota bacterium]|nr:undecaprenyldiphospho-muramoylpentapeptide beta-N-acetylglucosaminyltransferase [Bacteroidota bacterium]
MTRPPRILLAGGGTGGHVYPAIAIAQALRTMVPDSAIAFAGTRDRLEMRAVPKAGFAIHPITVSGFHRRQMSRNLKLPFKLAAGMWQSWRLVKDFDADVVVGTGGYVSGPVLWAASMRGRPTVAQEQNAYAGITNRLVSRRAAQVHIAFPEAKKWFPPGKCRLSGNPVRPGMGEVSRPDARQALGIPPEARVLFVFGGSLGSQAINEAMQAAIPELLKDPELQVIWQTGRLYYERLRHLAQDRLRVLKYVNRMDQAYAACDLVLCRAGAITCSELLVTASSAILVPSPNVAEDHQTRNAESMERLKAALHVPQEKLSDALAVLTPQLLQSPERLMAMRDAARRAARPDAASAIARDILDLIAWRRAA